MWNSEKYEWQEISFELRNAPLFLKSLHYMQKTMVLKKFIQEVR